MTPAPTGSPTPADADAGPGRPLLGIALAAVGGVALAVQARLNGLLGAGLHDGVLAATISFGSGLVVLALGVSALPAGRRGLRRLRSAVRGGGIRWWQCVGGASGAFLVASQGLTVAELGVAVFTVAVVAGQVLSSLVVDRAGLGPQGVQPLTARRTVGALLAVPAVAVAVANQFGHAAVLAVAALPLLAGFGTAWQQAVNGRVRAAAESAFVAALVNFAVGSAVLVLVSAALLPAHGWPAAAPTRWWYYCGGLLGIVVVATAATAVRQVGVLVVGLCSVAGQLAGALLLEVVAPAGNSGSPLFPVLGTVLALVAVTVASLPTGGASERMSAGTERGAR